MKVLLKKTEAREPGKFLPDSRSVLIGDLLIDSEKFIVSKGGKTILLTKKEFELLSLLISRPEKVYTREEIFQAVWGNNIIVGDRTIDVHIRKLRKKISEEYIQTIKGVGYKFVNPDSDKT
jgi:two-component system alkaline phosphatase synthesis response regulator PhoP